MYIDYKILWIDDRIIEFKGAGWVKDIEEHLEELGFIPKIIISEGGQGDVDKKVDQMKYDLIISDFNLNDNNGAVIISRIREKNIGTEILFYSANVDYTDEAEVIRKLKFKDRITYHYGREGLLEKIEKTIELTLDKLLELNATRGLITAETSELDVIMEEFSLELAKKKTTGDLDQLIKDYIKDCLEKRPTKFLENYNKVGFEKIFHLIEAKRKWEIFRKLLKQHNQGNLSSEIVEFLLINNDYEKDVIKVRNIFSHCQATINNEGKQILMGRTECLEYDREKCIEIRNKLIKHRDSFEKLKRHLHIE